MSASLPVVAASTRSSPRCGPRLAGLGGMAPAASINVTRCERGPPSAVSCGRAFEIDRVDGSASSRALAGPPFPFQPGSGYSFREESGPGTGRQGLGIPSRAIPLPSGWGLGPRANRKCARDRFHRPVSRSQPGSRVDASAINGRPANIDLSAINGIGQAPTRMVADWVSIAGAEIEPVGANRFPADSAPGLASDSAAGQHAPGAPSEVLCPG